MSKSLTIGKKEKDTLMSAGSPIIVVKNDFHNRVELHIRGMIPPPEYISDEITTLYHLAAEYDTIMVVLNSSGGAVTSEVELFSIMKMFKNIITVGTGEVCSAAFTLWCAGHIRVLQPYTSIMCHRESYGFGGKTDQHLDLANHCNEIYTSMYNDISTEILTEDEIERSRYTEVFFTGEELIKRGVAIPWTKFIRAQTVEPITSTYVTIGDDTYLDLGDGIFAKMIEGEDEVIAYEAMDILYGVNNPRRIITEG